MKPQHEEDGVLYCDEHGAYQCRACGHDPQLKRLEAQGAGECRSGGHKYEPCTNPEHQTQHCASVEPWGECRALPPTPPTPAGEEALIDHPFYESMALVDSCILTVAPNTLCRQPRARHRKPPAPPEADGGKARIWPYRHESNREGDFVVLRREDWERIEKERSASPADGAEGLLADALEVALGAILLVADLGDTRGRWQLVIERAEKALAAWNRRRA